MALVALPEPLVCTVMLFTEPELHVSARLCRAWARCAASDELWRKLFERWHGKGGGDRGEGGSWRLAALSRASAKARATVSRVLVRARDSEAFHEQCLIDEGPDAAARTARIEERRDAAECGEASWTSVFYEVARGHGIAGGDARAGAVVLKLLAERLARRDATRGAQRRVELLQREAAASARRGDALDGASRAIAMASSAGESGGGAASGAT